MIWLRRGRWTHDGTAISALGVFGLSMILSRDRRETRSIRRFVEGVEAGEVEGRWRLRVLTI